MGLPASEQRVLDTIENDLRITDQQLAAAFAAFTRFASGTRMPRPERLAARHRLIIRLRRWRIGGLHRTAAMALGLADRQGAGRPGTGASPGAAAGSQRTAARRARRGETSRMRIPKSGSPLRNRSARPRRRKTPPPLDANR